MPKQTTSIQQSALRWTVCLPLLGCSVFFGVVAVLLIVAVGLGATPDGIQALAFATGLAAVTVVLVKTSVLVLGHRPLSGAIKLALACSPLLLVATVFGCAL